MMINMLNSPNLEYVATVVYPEERMIDLYNVKDKQVTILVQNDHYHYWRANGHVLDNPSTSNIVDTLAKAGVGDLSYSEIILNK
jgi:hypothetical protein